MRSLSLQVGCNVRCKTLADAFDATSARAAVEAVKLCRCRLVASMFRVISIVPRASLNDDGLQHDYYEHCKIVDVLCRETTNVGSARPNFLCSKFESR